MFLNISGFLVKYLLKHMQQIFFFSITVDFGYSGHSDIVVTLAETESFPTISSLTPSTLDSCSYRFKMYLQADNMPSHMVKTSFKYSF